MNAWLIGLGVELFSCKYPIRVCRTRPVSWAKRTVRRNHRWAPVTSSTVRTIMRSRRRPAASTRANSLMMVNSGRPYTTVAWCVRASAGVSFATTLSARHSTVNQLPSSNQMATAALCVKVSLSNKTEINSMLVKLVKLSIHFFKCCYIFLLTNYMFMILCLFTDVTSRMEPSIDKSSRPGCEFEGDNKFHPAGSRWHPYLPPFGFSKCAICVCDVSFKIPTINNNC